MICQTIDNEYLKYIRKIKILPVTPLTEKKN